MKIAINGTSRGLGNFLANHLNKSSDFEIITITERLTDYENILRKLHNVDVFINNAHSEFQQTILTYKLFEYWRADPTKFIISIGSRAGEDNLSKGYIYSASKASADHWVRSYFHTYGLPTLISQCSNNYGPYQHQEKLIPTVIRTALSGHGIPIYGKGDNRRDWLYVEDHCNAILLLLENAKPGESFTIGGGVERDNLTLCKEILTILDGIKPKQDGSSYQDQIRFVEDRPGHDFRYAINATKIKATLGWEPQHTFDQALHKTVVYYLEKYSAKKER